MSLERLFGRQLPAAEKGTIPTLNVVPKALLAEARELAARSRLAAVELLQHYVVISDLDHVAPFIEDVVYGGNDPETWGWFDALCVPSIAIEKALVHSTESVIVAVSAMEGDRWWCIEPSLSNWDWSGLVGAPGVIVRHVPYYWSEPDEVIGNRLTDERITRVPDIALAVRRWLASRVACKLRSALTEGDLTSVSAICAALGLADAQLSIDGRLSLTGIIREANELPLERRSVPGYAGPDEWYCEIPPSSKN